MNGYLGEIKMFAGNYPPAAWAYCQGQLLPVGSYTSLFAILSNVFGGNGRTDFALPDMRGRTAVGSGNGPGLNPKYLGQYGGYEYEVLTNAHMPPHTHAVHCDMDSGARQLSAEPEGRIPAKITPDATKGYGRKLEGHTMNPDMLGTTGSAAAFDIHQPWLCINHIICTDGMWPPRS